MGKKSPPPRPSGKRWAVLGASECGKGIWVKAQLAQLAPARLLVWDYLGEYGAHARAVLSLRALALAVARAGSGPFRYGYTSRARDAKALRAEFAAFCSIAWAVGDCMVVIEELSRVTTASWAPPEWAQLCNMGSHHRRLHVIGISQHPAQIDKALLGNATLIHTGALRTARHRAAVAEEMDIDPADIAALAPLEYLERDFTVYPPVVRRGRVELPRRRPSPPPAIEASPDPAGTAAPGDR